MAENYVLEHTDEHNNNKMTLLLFIVAAGNVTDKYLGKEEGTINDLLKSMQLTFAEVSHEKNTTTETDNTPAKLKLKKKAIKPKLN